MPVERRSRAAEITAFVPGPTTATDATVVIHGQEYPCIRNVDRMPPFLMSVVSDSDFWLFVGSNGGFTAGRVDPDHAVFPYQSAARDHSQSLQARRGDQRALRGNP